MNLESYLAEVVGQGRFDPFGQFGLALPQLLDKLAHFQFPDPAQAPLALLSAAVSTGAERVEVEVAGPKISYRLALPEPDLNQPHSPLLWALAANRGSARRIELTCPQQGRALLLTRAGHQLVSRSPSQGQVTVHIEREKGFPNESLTLTRHCTLCPIPIQLDGQPLQVSLGKAYRGRSAAWSASLPELFRPAGPALLKTPLSLFLFRSAAPVWVAVVGAVSYPFVLPEVRNVCGVLWSSSLRTDLGLSSVVQDETWQRCRDQLRELARSLHLFEQILSDS